MYERFRCTLRHEISTSDWFLATVRVRIWSPFMFLLGIDRLMREVAEGKRGIHWTFTTTLEGEDFADDITLQSHTQQNTRVVKKFADKVTIGNITVYFLGWSMFYYMTTKLNLTRHKIIWIKYFSKDTAIFTLHELDIYICTISYFYDVNWRETTGRHTCCSYSK